MSLDVSALLSLYSGLTGADTLPDNGLEGGGLPEQFAAALNEQLDLLRQAAQFNSPSDALPEWMALQDIAPSTGKELPLSEQGIDIDLEATLQALAKVLATIESDKAAGDGIVSQSLTVDDEGKTDAVDDGLLGALAASLPAELVRDAESMKTAKSAGFSEAPPPSSASEKAAQLESDRVAQAVLPEDSAKAGAAAGRHEQSLLVADEAPVGREDKTSVAGMGGGRTSDGSALHALDGLVRMPRAAESGAKAELASVGRHFAHPQWGQEFSDRLVWMHRQQIPSAELNLNPRHLGPISIRIDVNQDQTSIAFATQHAVVKEAIEAALPRLREMLGAQQLNLVNVDVSQQQSGRDSGGHFSQFGAQSHSGDESFRREQAMSGLVEEIEAGRAVSGQGILNLFA